jgi:outer membrane protein OmpA-like peptidoglycan-associated protein
MRETSIMKRIHSLVLSLGVATVLAACSSTPERIEELDAARAAVAQVEGSPRAGVAAENVSTARKALNNADRLVENGGELEDIRYEASVANMNEQIANEKILTANARDEIEKGNADRQRILVESRERETREAQQRASILEEELRSLRAKPTERGMVLTLGDVLFDTGKATLKPGAYATIDRLASALRQSPDRKVVIEGHTDNVGSDATNQALSERRAHAVQAALMERGVSSNQITAMGKGEGYPVASNEDPGGRQQNRRVELIFEQPGGSRVASDAD